MKTYQVTWMIEVDADSPLEAAQKALEIQRNKESTATAFQINEHVMKTYYVDAAHPPENDV